VVELDRAVKIRPQQIIRIAQQPPKFTCVQFAHSKGGAVRRSHLDNIVCVRTTDMSALWLSHFIYFARILSAAVTQWLLGTAEPPLSAHPTAARAG
jgi:hypothetical protein